MKFDIVKITKDDIETIYNIKRASIFDYVNGIWGWDEAYQLEDFNYSFVIDNFRKVVINNEIIGFYELDETDTIINITEIHLIKKFQGKGIGTEIIKSIINKGKEINKNIKLGVFKENTMAKKLYLQLGFNIYEETATHYLMVFENIG